MKKKAILYALFAALVYFSFQLLILEKITPVPESIGYYKWFIYSFVAVIHGILGYYWYVFHFYKKQQKKLLGNK